MDKKVHYKMHKVKKQWVTIAVTGMSLGAVSAVSLGTNDGVVQADEHTDATVAIPDITVDTVLYLTIQRLLRIQLQQLQRQTMSQLTKQLQQQLSI